MKKSKNSERGDIDIVGLIFVLMILGGLYYFVFFPQMRGPAADMEVNAAIQPNGNISEYKVTLQFVDDLSYSQFLAYLNSEKYPSMNEYEVRTLAASHAFSVINDSSKRTVMIEARQPFEPNNMTTNIRLIRNPDTWEFEDRSVVNSSHLPEIYINKLTYTLTIPAELIYANTLENSSSWWSDEKQVIWNIDRNKNPLNPRGDSISSPRVFAKFKVPQQNAIPKIAIVVAGILILALIVYFIRRR